MARRADDGGGHPFFWLLLGFLCGVVGTLGGLLLLSSEVTGTADPAPQIGEPVETAPAADAGAPVATPPPQSSPPSVVVAPQPMPVPPPKGAPAAARGPAAPNTDAQIAEDAAASGMTARTR